MSIRSRLAKLERVTKIAEWQPAVLIPLKSGERQALLRSISDRLGMTVPELLATYEAQTGADVSEMVREYEDEKALAADPMPMPMERSSATEEAR
jgi:hypothetical protein